MSSQTGVITSVGHGTAAQDGLVTLWNVQFTYTQDNGQPGSAFATVGSAPECQYVGWATASSTISVTAPGCANPVLLPCPPIYQYQKFGTILPGSVGPAPQTNF